MRAFAGRVNHVGEPVARRQATTEAGPFVNCQISRCDPADCCYDKNGPPDKLTLAFATADVVLLGWKLSNLANHLRNGDLLWVRSAPARYANLDRSKTYVASITVEPISKE